MSEAFFFFGTLRYLPLLYMVLGREVVTTPANLPDWHAEAVKGADVPMLVKGGGADGHVVQDLTSKDILRLNAYQRGLGYTLEEVTIETATGNQTAKMYRAPENLAPSGETWQLEDWIVSSGSTALEAVAEIMRAHERAESPKTLAKRLPMIWARAASRSRNGMLHRPRTVGSSFSREDVTPLEHRIAHEAFFRLE